MQHAHTFLLNYHCKIYQTTVFTTTGRSSSWSGWQVQASQPLYSTSIPIFAPSTPHVCCTSLIFEPTDLRDTVKYSSNKETPWPTSIMSELSAPTQHSQSVPQICRIVVWSAIACLHVRQPVCISPWLILLVQGGSKTYAQVTHHAHPLNVRPNLGVQTSWSVWIMVLVLQAPDSPMSYPHTFRQCFVRHWGSCYLWMIPGLVVGCNRGERSETIPQLCQRNRLSQVGCAAFFSWHTDSRSRRKVCRPCWWARILPPT